MRALPHSSTTPTLRHLVLPIAASAALLLSGCSTPSAGQISSDPVAGGTLVYASGDAEPSCLDPHVGGNYPQALVASQYLESLVSRDSSGVIIPWLASEWVVSDDGLSWDFTLRDDVLFTDGTPLNAEAVKVNIDHIRDPETHASTSYLALKKVESIEVVSDTVARFHLSEPDSALLESLSQPWIPIESPAGIERGVEANCQAPIGTGPFIVENWVKQDHISLVRNDTYNSPPADAAHEGPAYLDAITWRFIPESASRYAALQAGEVDVIDNAQPDTIKAATQTGTLVELDAPRPGASNRLEFNTGKAPFDDVLVREAFVRAVDINDGIESLFFGSATRSYSALSSVEDLGYSDKALFAHDLDAANQLLDDAGWTSRDAVGYRTKDGVRLSLAFPVSTNQSIPAEQSLFEQIQATAKDAGFEITISLLDLPSWHKALSSENYDLVSAPYTKVGPDVLRILFHSASIVPSPSGYAANHAKVSDPEIDALLAAAVATNDPAERATLYEQAQKLILGGFYILPLYDQQNHYLLGPSVHGTRALPSVSTPTFYDTWLSE